MDRRRETALLLRGRFTQDPAHAARRMVADGSLRKAFGVPKTLGLLPGRVTYVIDKEGVVRHVFSSQFSAERHVAEALAMVRQLAQS